MKIAVVGAAGRMGQMLVRRIAATEGMTLGGASESPNSNAIGRDAGELAGLGGEAGHLDCGFAVDRGARMDAPEAIS